MRRAYRSKTDVCLPKKIDENVETGRYYTPPPHPPQKYHNEKKRTNAGPVFGP